MKIFIEKHPIHLLELAELELPARANDLHHVGKVLTSRVYSINNYTLTFTTQIIEGRIGNDRETTLTIAHSHNPDLFPTTNTHIPWTHLHEAYSAAKSLYKEMQQNHLV